MTKSDELMQRVLRFLNYNLELYRHHRQRGDYRAAVERLERASKLVDVAERVKRERNCELSWMDWASLELARQHSNMVLTAKPLDF